MQGALECSRDLRGHAFLGADGLSGPYSFQKPCASEDGAMV